MIILLVGENFMKKILSIMLLFMTIVFLGCSGNEDSNTDPELKPVTINLKGYAQKGPFVNGSAVEISELDSSLNLTGKKFNTQIISDDGKIELNNLTLQSPIIEIKADGYYFNEVSGEKTDSQITLYSIADVSNVSTVNANLLTTVERRRVRYLISQGKTLAEAKEQAQGEIFSAFNMTVANYVNSEQLSIDGTTDADGAMLALTLILTGYRTNAELTELLSRLSTDIEKDGTIDNEMLKPDLLGHATGLNFTEIRENIEDYYLKLGVTMTAPNFEQFITSFIDNTDFTLPPIVYEEDTDYGKNILNENVTLIKRGDKKTNAVQATLPVGRTLKVKITSLNPRFNTSIDWTENITTESMQQNILLISFGTGEGLATPSFGVIGSYRIDFYEFGGDNITKTKMLSVVDDLTTCDTVSCDTGKVCNVFTGTCVEPLCETVACGEHGECEVDAGVAKCNCDADYEDKDLYCRLIPTQEYGENCNNNDKPCKDGLVCIEGMIVNMPTICLNSCTEQSDSSDECDGNKCMNSWSGNYCEPNPEKIKNLGEECNYAIDCLDELTCYRGYCYKPCATVTDSDPNCKDSKACRGMSMDVENGEPFLCEPSPDKTQNLGEECNHIGAACVNGLFCYEGNCKTIGTQTENERCEEAGFLSCADGLFCALGVRVCKVPTQDLGEECDNETLGCINDLFCNDDHVCVEKTEEYGDKCNRNNLICKDGLACVQRLVGSHYQSNCLEICNEESDSSNECGGSTCLIEDSGSNLLYCEPNPEKIKNLGEECNNITTACIDGLTCFKDEFNNENPQYKSFCYKPCDSVTDSDPSCKDSKACMNMEGSDTLLCEPSPDKTQNLGEECNSISAACVDGLNCASNENDINGAKYCYASCTTESNSSNECSGNKACVNKWVDYYTQALSCEPNPSQAEGEACNSTALLCENNTLYCSPSSNTCELKTQEVGEICDEVDLVCKENLGCRVLEEGNNPVCIEMSQDIGDSCGETSLCLDGLLCLCSGDCKCYQSCNEETSASLECNDNKACVSICAGIDIFYCEQ